MHDASDDAGLAGAFVLVFRKLKELRHSMDDAYPCTLTTATCIYLVHHPKRLLRCRWPVGTPAGMSSHCFSRSSSTSRAISGPA